MDCWKSRAVLRCAVVDVNDALSAVSTSWSAGTDGSCGRGYDAEVNEMQLHWHGRHEMAVWKVGSSKSQQ